MRARLKSQGNRLWLTGSAAAERYDSWVASMIRSSPMSHRLPSASVLDHFSVLSDPRQRWRVLYPLPEILLLVLCATLSGMEAFVEIRLWGDQRLDFLRRFFPYERGLPAHAPLHAVSNGPDAGLSTPCTANR